MQSIAWEAPLFTPVDLRKDGEYLQSLIQHLQLCCSQIVAKGWQQELCPDVESWTWPYTTCRSSGRKTQCLEYSSWYLGHNNSTELHLKYKSIYMECEIYIRKPKVFAYVYIFHLQGHSVHPAFEKPSFTRMVFPLVFVRIGMQFSTHINGRFCRTTLDYLRP